jgi:hypothetical protein
MSPEAMKLQSFFLTTDRGLLGLREFQIQGETRTRLRQTGAGFLFVFDQCARNVPLEPPHAQPAFLDVTVNEATHKSNIASRPLVQS